MAKLAILAALFAGLIAVASATTYTTVVTTTVVDDENPQQSCQTEIQKSTSHCRMWMQEGRGGRQFLRSAIMNPQYQEEHLEDCCDQLKKIAAPCRCDAIRKVVMDAQKQVESKEMEEMKRKAESLPQMCRMDSPTECRMRAVFF